MKYKILAYLYKNCFGYKNAINIRELRRIFKIKDDDIRYYVRVLRKEGFKICCIDNKGYFYSSNKAFITLTIQRIKRNVEGAGETIEHLAEVKEKDIEGIIKDIEIQAKEHKQLMLNIEVEEQF